MDNGDLQRIMHMKRYCIDIAKAISRFGNSYELFVGDNDFYNSVSMSILQIGELSGGLTDEFKELTRTKMPWGLIKGMRNLFAHAYSTMNSEDIWETASKDIPVLLDFCNNILETAE